MRRPTFWRTNQLMRLVAVVTIAIVCLTALLWGLSSPALAGPAATVRYVDGAGGSDSSDCTDSGNPCATIQYAIDQSGPGDEVRVAEGTYSETIFMPHSSFSLLGGYEATGWTQDITGNPTIIDAGGVDDQVVSIVGDTFVEGFTIQGANHVSNNAGGIAINTATAVISATIIQNNSAVGAPNSGGGIWFEGEGVNITLINSAILNNWADGSGGGIAGCCTNDNAALTLDNVLVSGNGTQGEGAGLRLSPGVDVTINNSQIVSNTASGCCGGGIRAAGVPITITNSSILANTTNGGGGGIFADNNSSLHLNNVNISDNQAQGSGGGLALSGNASADITGGQIANNTTANGGGGLWLESSDATLNSVLVQGNQAVSSGFASGGGVDTSNSSLTLNDSIIEDNVVQSTGGGETLGGAINNNFGTMVMANTIIRNNDSQGTPVVQIYQAVLTTTNTLVSDNLGPGFAGTLAQGNFTNVTIAGNDGFGLGIGPLETGDPAVNVTVVNSILWGKGGTDYFCDTSVGQVTCTLAYSDVGVGDIGGTGNISADPLFTDAANGDYHLSVGSPAIDAGTAVGAPATDIEGIPRDAAPDMGAYEWVGYRIYLPVILK